MGAGSRAESISRQDLICDSSQRSGWSRYRVLAIRGFR
jgi:hypothetical protein